VFYQFNGNAGDRYYFVCYSSRRLHSSSYCDWSSDVCSSDLSVGVNSDVDTFTLPQTGTYTVTVEGRVYDTRATGDYAFNLVPERSEERRVGKECRFSCTTCQARQRE